MISNHLLAIKKKFLALPWKQTLKSIKLEFKLDLSSTPVLVLKACFSLFIDFNRFSKHNFFLNLYQSILRNLKESLEHLEQFHFT
ncbi:hypothetical protein BpHYR1_013657 [Brachionus plicatilis]|uniref:Uncharacterized protein n=1 Tax=Brachionus plicatilis TaxID=10195 RepID=A0A3M7SXQ3_BRAPC|nr:hypothetical protein BpHYR1_013657 [Brachionus plicatilis]